MLKKEEILKLIGLIEEPVLVLSPSLLIVDFNPIAEKLLKLDKKKSINQSLSAIFPYFLLKHPIHFVSQIGKKTYLWRSLLLKNNPQSRYILIGSTHEKSHSSKISDKLDKTSYGTINYLDQFLTGQLDDKSNDTLSEVKNIYNYMENIIAEMPVSVYWMNKNFIYLGCNNNMAKLFNLKSRKDIIGKTYADLYDEKSAAHYKKADKMVMSTGKAISLEEPLYYPDGKKEIYLSNKVPLRNTQGETIGMVGISVNITERKQIEEELRIAKESAEAASKAKTEFLENMRHDIRTPLTGIVGFSEIIKAETEDSSIKEYADNLMASSHALLHLLDEVLEAICVSTGEIPKAKKKFSLAKLLQHVIDLNKAKAASKHLNLTCEIDNAIPQFLLGDSVRFHRIVLELIANALNFTDVGFVNIKAKLAKQKKRQIIIELTVEDSGMGIPKEKQQEIFLQFTRLTPSYKGLYKGAGLGLAVIKQFVDELDGEIYVDSEINKGTTFTCIIPLKIPLLENDTGVKNDFSETIQSSPSLMQEKKFAVTKEPQAEFLHRILLVEDNNIAQKAAKAILKQFNCHIDVAEDGKMALQYWKQNDYDLIFMDIGLPDMDGYQVTHYIRLHEITKKNNTPIIALTAHVGEENKERCIAAGMNAVLSKPLTHKSCGDIIHSFIAKENKEKEITANPYASDLPETENHLFELNNYPLLDTNEGMKTTGTKEILAEMLQFTVEQSLPQDMETLQKAHDNNDWDKCQQLAHKIKGGVVYIGAMRMKMACQYLERYWKIGKRDLLEELYQQVLQVANETITTITLWLKKNT